MTTRGPRRNFTVLIAAAVYFSLSTTAPAAVHYVNINSASPTAPYTSWASAATVIQDAVDAAAPGDQVLVTNGIYQTGGHIVFGSMSNRVAVTTPITLQSVNGAGVTVIQGQQNPGTITGSNAVRCVYLTNNATLLGFTLTNGATRDSGDALKERSGGGAWCESNAVITACTIVGNQASDSGGGVNGGIVNNCTLTKNSAGGGGGAKDANLTSCLVSGNSAGDGGGVLGGFVNGCTLTGNSAGDAGGGADFCTLTNCVLTDNTAYVAGGGVYAATANNCTMNNNWSNAGGGAGFCTLNNCLIIGNSAN